MFAPSRSRLALRLALVGALGVTLSACKMAGSKPSAPGAAYKEADADPLAELARLEQQMDALGLPVARPSTGVAPTGGGDGAGMSTSADGDFAEAPSEEAEAFAPEEPARDEAEVGQAPMSRAERRGQADQCNSVCDLSVAICDLEIRICSLSDSHQGDPTYVDACQRAGDDCEVAEYECERCGER